MFPGRFPMMDVNPRYVVERDNALQRIQHDLWPLDEIDPKKEKFPCCLVWIPLPVVSWLAPFVGHVGICREDGTVVDFSGSNMINVGNLSYGAVARYYQLDRRQCCFPPNLAGHACKQSYQHAEFGTAVSWDDAIHSSTLSFEHRHFNPFTCNDHSFVADCLNRLSYGGSMNWNMVNVGVLVLAKGQWVNGSSILRSFMPFIVMACFGLNKKKYETLSYLPDLSVEQLLSEIEYLLKNGWVPCLEFETERGFVYREHHKSPGYYDGRYWTMWKLPMFGCTDATQVLAEVEEAKKAYPQAWIRIIGFDNVRQVQCISFIAYKPEGY